MEPHRQGWVLGLVMLIALLPPALLGTAMATSHDVPVVFVANSKEGTVDVVDAGTYQILRTVDVLPKGKPSVTDPSLDRSPDQTANAIFVNRFAGDNVAHDLDLSPDGTTLYVSRGHMADVAAFDLTQDPAELAWTARVDGFRADHMTISADGAQLFISDLTEDQVIALDTATGARLGSFATGDYAHGVAVIVPAPAPSTLSPENEAAPGASCTFLPDGALDEEPDACVYAASIGDVVTQPPEAREDRPDAVDTVAGEPYELTVADADTLEVVRRIEFPAGIRPADFLLSQEEKLMYYQESFFHGIVEYDLVQAQERRRVQLPIDDGVTEDDYSFESPHHGLALSADGSTLCAAGRASDYVALVPTDTLLPEAIVEVGDAPGWAITGPDGTTCWVASTGSDAEDPEPGADTVSVISYDTGDKLAVIDAGKGPKHLLPATVPGTIVP